MMGFYSPLAFTLLLVIAGVTALRVAMRSAGIRFSWLGLFKDSPKSLRLMLMPVPMILRVACLTLLVIAIARPREGISLSSVSVDGVAMELVVDRSTSMAEEMDYHGRKLNRFQTVKLVIDDFISGKDGDFNGREGDLIGLITFARYPDTVCPLVRNHKILLDFLKDTKMPQIRSEDGTAIGEAVALAAARLDSAEKEINRENAKLTASSPDTQPEFTIKSKVIVLLTDGINNSGDISPIEAAKMAAKWGIKIYAIGIGSNSSQSVGMFSFPVTSQLDERLLSRLAKITGGFYARADNAEQLKAIYEKIDGLEKTEIKSLDYYDYNEKFLPWAIAALSLLLAEVILSNTILRKSP